jgi:flagellar hook protein FlgE
MFNSFSAALSALKAHASAVDAVGHNLANVNTSGFKSADVAFKDLVAQSLNSGSESGLGVSRPSTVRHFTQGAVQSTSGQLDAALQGNGFFVVRDEQGAEFYTRDGGFKVDKSGVLRTLTGEKVQGWTAVNGVVTASGVPDQITIPTGTSKATATETFSLVANLDSAGVVGEASGSYSTILKAYDANGQSHDVLISFTKSAANEWDYTVDIPGETISSTPTGTLTFNGDGSLVVPAPPDPIVITVDDLTNGAGPLNLSWDVYGNADDLTQLALPSSVSRTIQDGSPAGQLVDVGMADGGLVVARFDNGTQQTVAKIAVALFTNPGSLGSAGNNLFRVTGETGSVTYNEADKGGAGKIKAQALEASNVDIAREFTNLIVYQRGYQANSRVITTADELSQETLNLKR